MLGSPEMFIDTSSILNLTCIISWTNSPPDKIVWYHNNTEVSVRGPRSGVSLMVDKAQETKVTLLLQNPKEKDSGVYVCNPSNAPNASIAIHVLTGKVVCFTRISE